MIEKINQIGQEVFLKVIGYVAAAMADHPFVFISSIIVSVMILIIIAQTYFVIKEILTNKFIGLHAHPLKYHEGRGNKRVLLAGDSTMVGAGAVGKEETIPGRLAANLIATSIYSVALSGATTPQVLNQISKIKNQKFDLVIISTGGNDLFKKRLDTLAPNLHQLLKQAKKISNKKPVLLIYGLTWAQVAIPFILRWFFAKKAAKVQEIIKKVAKEEEVLTIELFTEEDSKNPFLMHPKKYLARDGIHPNGNGYKLWYEKMWQELIRHGYLADLY